MRKASQLRSFHFSCKLFASGCSPKKRQNKNIRHGFQIPPNKKPSKTAAKNANSAAGRDPAASGSMSAHAANM